MKALTFSLVMFLVMGVTAAWAGCCGAAKPMADQAAVVPATHAQATCPVMGGAFEKSVYSDYKGYRIYFCCGACKITFAKDPEKYIKQMESEGVQLEKAPAQE